jgi:hypothetical protein
VHAETGNFLGGNSLERGLAASRFGIRPALGEAAGRTAKFSFAKTLFGAPWEIGAVQAE